MAIIYRFVLYNVAVVTDRLGHKTGAKILPGDYKRVDSVKMSSAETIKETVAWPWATGLTTYTNKRVSISHILATNTVNNWKFS